MNKTGMCAMPKTNAASKITTVAIAALLSLDFAGTADAAEKGAVETPIRIAVNEWTGQHISAQMAGQLLERLGYNVEYVTAGAVPQWSAMSQGTLHLQPEAWDNNVGNIYEKALSSGDLVKIGELGIEAREGWIYPHYMEEQCPGLPAVESLIACAQVFASPETFPRGRLITYPADWGTRSKELVANADLPFKPIAGGSEGAMIAELKSAYAARQPMLMMFWEPHWIFAEHDFNWIDLPDHAAGCDVDPALGIRPDATGDCGFAQASVSKIASKNFQENWPAAYELIEQLSITNEVQNRLILEIDNKKRPVEDVVSEWIENNPGVWQPWIEAAQN